MPLTADCLARLQLKQEPFAPAADEAFLYTDTLLDSVQTVALTALAQPNAIVLFTGGSGSGRSVQLMQSLSNLPPEWSLIAFRGRKNTTFASVDVTIRNHLRGLGIEAGEHPLQTLLCALSQQPVIAIDDAHLLGSDIVRQLLNLRAAVIATTQQQVRLLLVGTAASVQQYTHALEPADLEQFTRVTIRPFNLEQVQSYLAHRLRVAGCENPDVWLKPADVTQLYQRSEGIPLALNMLATEWLTRLCRALEREANKPPPEPPVVEMMIGGAATTHKRHPTPSAGAASPALWQRRWFMPTLVGLVIGGVVLLLAHNMHQPPPDTFTMTSIAPARITTAVTTPSAPAPPPFDFSALLRDVRAMLTQWYHTVVTPAPAPTVLSPPPAPVTAAPAPPVPVTASPAADVAAPAVTVATLTPTPALVPPPAVKPPTTVATVPAAPTAGTVTSARVVDPDLAWLAQQDTNAFAVQLLTAMSRQVLADYIDQHRLQDVRIIASRNQRFLAILGSFPDRTAAATAAARLPLAVLSQGHWVRRIADIQAEARP